MVTNGRKVGILFNPYFVTVTLTIWQPSSHESRSSGKVLRLRDENRRQIMVQVGLLVRLKSKLGKEMEVETFLRTGLLLAEAEALVVQPRPEKHRKYRT